MRLIFDLGLPNQGGIFVDVDHFRFTDAAGQEHGVRVDDDPLTAGPVMGLLNRRVTTAVVQDRKLTLTFDTGARIVCPPHPQYEAWAAGVGRRWWSLALPTRRNRGGGIHP
ncbi:DUF6188 family protein [Nocardia stercoris]|uniref:Uncharacterized protein n=1 Tax=Nocardia stercoris TaxID=2483361 RepID=A0A3M2LC96_9NOCA|nr:DUF6188 family protein [Nocardia stercoris]RMI33595.1 hypothetical protein EBN03_10860 [Nocardia stercoris]